MGHGHVQTTSAADARAHAANPAERAQQEWLRASGQIQKFTDETLEGKSAEHLRKVCVELRGLLQLERSEQEQIQGALVTDYANVKVRLAQAEYDKDRIRLERTRLQHQVAQLKLRIIEQQQQITRYEAKHATGKKP